MAVEMLPAILACHFGWHFLADSDLVWYCDNSSAVASMIKGASRAKDLCRVAVLTHLAWAKASIRGWIEWVDSFSNPADPISREGNSEAVSAQLGVAVSELPCFNLASLLEGSLASALDAIVPRGR